MSCDVRDEKPRVILIESDIPSSPNRFLPDSLSPYNSVIHARPVACPAMSKKLPWIHGIDGLACLDTWTI